MKVAFQGERGAYSEAAIKKTFPDAEAVACQTFHAAFEALETGKVDVALIPVENSTEGSVSPVYDLLVESNVKAFHEVFLKVEHCLIGYTGCGLSDIKEVYSHPQALGQCTHFLKKIRVKTISHYDTAGAVKMLSKLKKKDVAAIASEVAAEYYGMKILKKNIEDNPNNITRFLALTKDKKTEFEKGKKYKTSIVFSIKHVPGALFKVIKVFADEKINLTKIESRPTKKTPWEYIFFVDFEGHVEEGRVRRALKEVEDNSFFVRIIGSYPKGD